MGLGKLGRFDGKFKEGLRGGKVWVAREGLMEGRFEGYLGGNRTD